MLLLLLVVVVVELMGIAGETELGERDKLVEAAAVDLRHSSPHKRFSFSAAAALSAPPPYTDPPRCSVEVADALWPLLLL